MRTRITRIGRSRGILIPKRLIDRAGITEDVKVSVRRNALIITPIYPPRTGWAKAFALMAPKGEDGLVDATLGASRWDNQEWEW